MKYVYLKLESICKRSRFLVIQYNSQFRKCLTSIYKQFNKLVTNLPKNFLTMYMDDDVFPVAELCIQFCLDFFQLKLNKSQIEPYEMPSLQDRAENQYVSFDHC